MDGSFAILTAKVFCNMPNSSNQQHYAEQLAYAFLSEYRAKNFDVSTQVHTKNYELNKRLDPSDIAEHTGHPVWRIYEWLEAGLIPRSPYYQSNVPAACALTEVNYLRPSPKKLRLNDKRKYHENDADVFL